ncbi:hypothetical protein B0T25DRAFT_537898 [Lasiosphaeria hispida]|uniref:Uncharacterized protein n=1 Tax=Lasiosphaeria hispida TaxID=260671 RepID=A0AAJ0HLC3_9PEZI|nr:hypothetical protein B0T25DRAFT_537898 [Lasiosphaeria hispida]
MRAGWASHRAVCECPVWARVSGLVYLPHLPILGPGTGAGTRRKQTHGKLGRATDDRRQATGDTRDPHRGAVRPCCCWGPHVTLSARRLVLGCGCCFCFWIWRWPRAGLGAARSSIAPASIKCPDTNMPNLNAQNTHSRRHFPSSGGRRDLLKLSPLCAPWSCVLAVPAVPRRLHGPQRISPHAGWQNFG